MPLARDFRKMGRDALSGNWLLAVLVTLLAVLLGGAVYSGSFSIFCNIQEYYGNLHIVVASMITIYQIVAFIIGSSVEIGICSFYIKLQRREDCGCNDLFAYFNIFGKALLLRLYIGLLIFAWSLLLIVPGIIAAYRYSMATYLLSQNRELGVCQAVALSKKMMDGHKGRLFCLDISFIGWYLLACLTFGLGMLFLTPYVLSARAAFFLDLQYHYNLENGIYNQGTTAETSGAFCG